MVFGTQVLFSRPVNSDSDSEKDLTSIRDNHEYRPTMDVLPIYFGFKQLSSDGMVMTRIVVDYCFELSSILSPTI